MTTTTHDSTPHHPGPGPHDPAPPHPGPDDDAPRDATTPPGAAPPRPPRAYWVWLTGLAWTSAGVTLLSFGLVWAAASHSAALAGWVLLVVVLPRVTLSLLGGTVADRWGPARVMAGSDAVMTVVMATIAAYLLARGPEAAGPVLLLVTAGTMGVADAFYQPSAGAVPKLLVPPGALPRALAARQLVAHGSALAGPVLGGVVVAAAGLPLAFALGAVGFAGMLVVLLGLRRDLPMRPVQVDDAAPSTRPGTLTRMRDGLTVVARTPVLRVVTGVVAAFAGLVLPVTPLLVPVVARAQGWEATAAGVIAGASGGGIALVALVVSWRGGLERAGLAVGAGMTVAGVGVLALAAAPSPPWAALAALVTGLGTGVAVTHLGPIFVAAAPPDVMARAHAVVLTAQGLPLLVVNPGLGIAAEHLPAAVVVAGWGALGVLAGCLALTSGALRAARRPS